MTGPRAVDPSTVPGVELSTVVWRATVVLTGVGCVAVAAVPDGSRPVLVSGGLAAIACAVAAVTGWRLVGTLGLVLVTTTTLLADALDSSGLRPLRTLAAAVLLALLVVALDRAEDPPARGAVTVARAGVARTALLPTLALAAATLVTAAATLDVEPSVPLVLAGAVAAVAAVVLSVRGHRN